MNVDLVASVLPLLFLAGIGFLVAGIMMRRRRLAVVGAILLLAALVAAMVWTVTPPGQAV